MKIYFILMITGLLQLFFPAVFCDTVVIFNLRAYLWIQGDNLRWCWYGDDNQFASEPECLLI